MSYVVTLENVAPLDVYPVALRLETANGALDVLSAVCRQLAEDIPYERTPAAVAPAVDELLELASQFDALRTNGNAGAMPMVDHTVQLGDSWSTSLDGPMPRLRCYPSR